MAHYQITGGARLEGVVTISGAKNAALAIIPAAILALVLVAMYSGRGIYLDIAIVTAILGFLSQVLIGKYLEGTL